MTEFKPHVKVVQHPNPFMRSIHVNRELTEEASDRFGFGKSHYRFTFFSKQKMGDLVRTLMERLKAIQGVVGGDIGDYEIRVEIGEAFEWKDVGPIVLGEIVNSVFPEALGKKIDVSVSIGWKRWVRPSLDPDDDGYRTGYEDGVRRQSVEVGDPQILDIERFLDPEFYHVTSEALAPEQEGEKKGNVH